MILYSGRVGPFWLARLKAWPCRRMQSKQVRDVLLKGYKRRLCAQLSTKASTARQPLQYTAGSLRETRYRSQGC